MERKFLKKKLSLVENISYILFGFGLSGAGDF